MTRKESLQAVVKKFEETKDKSKKYPETDHYAVAAFWETRRKAKELWYKKKQGLE